MALNTAAVVPIAPTHVATAEMASQLFSNSGAKVKRHPNIPMMKTNCNNHYWKPSSFYKFHNNSFQTFTSFFRHL